MDIHGPAYPGPLPRHGDGLVPDTPSVVWVVVVVLEVRVCMFVYVDSSGKWRFVRIPDPKNIILAVTGILGGG